MKVRFGSRGRLALTLSLAALAALAVACSKRDGASSDDHRLAEAPASSSTSHAAPLSPTSTGTLPPGHPPIGEASPGPTMAAAHPGDGPDIAWDKPASWKEVPSPSAMRRATYQIASKDGAGAAELAVSTAGGGVDANVTRWASQFGDAKPKTDKHTVHGLAITTVEIQGTYAGGGPMMGGGAPVEHAMLLGAIVEQGEVEHFFKMIGPEATVRAAKADFDALVASVRPGS